MNNKLKIITEEEVLRFFGDDEKEEIAKYVSSLLSNMALGVITPEELIEAFRSEGD
jgi:hypothetical protein